MTETRYTLRPTLRAALMAFLVHHNPFYLLSALCMVSACFALNSGLSPHAGELPKLLALLGTLNVYEAILIALGLYLIRRRGVLRDGRTLLLIQAPFLFDLMFLNAEAGSVNLRDGTIIDLVALILAVAKARIVLRVLHGRMPRRAFAFTAAALAALFLIPVGFKWIEHRGPVTGVHFYAAWWIVGLLLVLWEVLGRFAPGEEVEADRGVARTMRRIYAMLPVLSLMAHLGMLHWVYLVDCMAADFAPLLLGMAVACGRLFPSPQARPIRVILPMLAVFLSFSDPALFHARLAGRVQLTPIIVSLAGAYGVYVYTFFLSRAAYLIGGALMASAVMAFGPTWSQIATEIEAAWDWASELVKSLMPRTAIQWGMTAMGASFAFLGLGAAVSLRKQSPRVAAEGEVKAD